MVRSYEWSGVESPKTAQLTGAESHDGSVFVSGKRGVLLRREAGEWSALLEKGSTGDGHNLLDCSVTDGGERVWYSGDSGTFGYYDLAADEAFSHQGPNDYTSGFSSVAATGAAGEEVVRVTNNSGRVITATVDGRDVSIDDSALPGECTSFTEVVETPEGPRIAGIDGHLYRPKPEAENEWEREQLVNARIVALAVGVAGLAAITDTGVLYGETGAFADEGRSKYADLELTNVEELAATGETFVAAGRDGGLAVVDAEGEATYPDPAPGVTLYGAEVTADGELIAVGSGGTILSGTSAEPDEPASERSEEDVVAEIGALLGEIDDLDDELLEQLRELLDELTDDDEFDVGDLLP